MYKQLILISSQNNPKKRLKKYHNKNLSSSNITKSQENIKTSAYYQKLYSINPDSNLESKNNINKNEELKIKDKERKILLKKVFKKPNYPKPEFQFRKITNPKLPFSNKNKKSPEEIKEHLRLARPSKIFHTTVNIQWLRKKFPQSVINKSIYTLLPNNGKPVVPEDESEEDKKHRLMIEFLENMKNPVGKDKYIDINPKYFFSKRTWETVLKLKQIFLDFDADGNRRMELDEMQEMFESNKISASIHDLVDLFFKGKKFKPKEIMKLYLNFHQFINFALTKDQEFRDFMRNIKEKADKESGEKIKKTKTISSQIKSSTISESNEDNDNDENKNNKEEKGHYFPMNFKSLLDYFIDRGRQRESKNVINNAIKEMNEIINKNIKKIQKKKFVNNNNASGKRKSSIGGDKITGNRQRPFKLSDNDLLSHSNINSNKKVNLTRRKTLFTQKSIIPNKLKFIIKGLKNVTKTEKPYLDKELDKFDLDLEEEDDDLNIDYDKQLELIDFQKLINEFANLFSAAQIYKKKPKKGKFSSKSIGQEIELPDTKINNKNKKNIIRKNDSNPLVNTIASSLTKENTSNNAINNNKISTTNHKDTKTLSIPDHKTFDKNIKLPSSHSYFNRINHSDKYGTLKKINVNNDYKTKYNFNNINIINDYMSKKDDANKRILPILKLNKNNSFNENNFRKNKIKLDKEITNNSHASKINLIKNDTYIKIPKSNSNSKLDYVPLGLLFGNNKKKIEYESKV